VCLLIPVPILASVVSASGGGLLGMLGGLFKGSGAGAASTRPRRRSRSLEHAQTRRRLVPRARLRPRPGVMSDNAKCYSTSFAFRNALAELGARHTLIPPDTPRWNGKIERVFGTLDTEWAHGRVCSNSTTRDRALSSLRGMPGKPSDRSVNPPLARGELAHDQQGPSVAGNVERARQVAVLLVAMSSNRSVSELHEYDWN
jgi:transposase InsO family protein